MKCVCLTVSWEKKKEEEEEEENEKEEEEEEEEGGRQWNNWNKIDKHHTHFSLSFQFSSLVAAPKGLHSVSWNK